MRIQIDLRVRKSGRELLDAVRRTAARELEGKVLGVVVGKFQPLYPYLGIRVSGFDAALVVNAAAKKN